MFVKTDIQFHDFEDTKLKLSGNAISTKIQHKRE